MEETAPPRPEFPPVVYLPTADEPDVAVRRVLMHRVEDGRTALYAYSAIDRLRGYYLPDSPWVLCDVATLQRIHDETPYDLLFLDVDPGLRDPGLREDTGGAIKDGVGGAIDAVGGWFD